MITPEFNLTPKQAIALQKQLAAEVSVDYAELNPTLIAGIDVGFENKGATTRAAVVVLDASSLDIVETQVARLPTTFPYVPGLLSFRELPAVMKAFSQLKSRPELVLCDGQGIAHPRRFGIACHLGVLVGIPTIGVGKTRLCGSYQEPGQDKGCWSPLEDKGEVIGAVLRTRKGCLPLFISPGHGLDLNQAISFTLAATTQFKLPETTRQAHKLASG